MAYHPEKRSLSIIHFSFIPEVKTNLYNEIKKMACQLYIYFFLLRNKKRVQKHVSY